MQQCRKTLEHLHVSAHVTELNQITHTLNNLLAVQEYFDIGYFEIDLVIDPHSPTEFYAVLNKIADKLTVLGK